MENGVQALKLAASILIFVMAITITISVFTSATQALNRIFNMQNDDEYVTDSNGNFLNFVNFDVGNGTREVGIEAIIPSIYRAYKENFVIYFYKSDRTTPLVLYTKDDGEEVNYIDLQRESHATPEEAIKSVNKLLYETSPLYMNGIYKEFQGKTFVEMLGEYYMNDAAGASDIAEVNKVKKRVIAYIEQ